MNASVPRWSQIRPRYGSAVLALLGIGLALGYAVSQETPRGRLTGVITRRDNNAPLPFARVTAYGNNKTFYTRADAKGGFTFAGLPAGDYEVSARSRSHAFEAYSAKTTVDESETTELALVLKRARPDLQLTQQQQVFLPDEKVTLPVHGYVDPNKTRHADVLRLRVWKTRLSHMMSDANTAQELARVSYRWQPPDSLPTVLLKPPSAPAPQLIEDRAVAITEADAEGFYHKRMPLVTRGAGLYLTEIAHREGEKTKTVCAWVNVTGTALVMKRAGSQVVAYVSDLKSGVAQPKFPVLFFNQGRKAGQALTNAEGIANYNATGDGKLMAVAQRGDDEAVLSRDNNSEENAGTIVSHVYTDRPIYRPGHKISFKGISRMRNAESGVRSHQPTLHKRQVYLERFNQTSLRSHYPTFRTPASTLADIEIRDPSGVRILKTQKPINSYGSFAGEVELSPEAPTGNYSLLTTIDGEENSTDILVASYRKPEFEVDVKPNKPRYIVGEGMQMEIVAKYYFGAPVAGAKVRFEIYRDSDWSSDSDEQYDDEYGGGDYGGYGEFIRDGEGMLDENGRLIINFSARSASEIEALQKGEIIDDPVAEQPQIYTAHVTITDAAEREVESEGKARLVAGDFLLDVKPSGYMAQPGKPFNLNIVARDHDSKPMPNIPVKLEYGYWRYEGESQNEYEMPEKSAFVALGSQQFTTDAQGVASASITLPRAGDFELVAQAQDKAGRVIRDSINIWAASESGDYGYEGGYREDLALFTDKKQYQSGETARVLINSAQTGQSVLLSLEGEQIYKTWMVSIKQSGTVVRVPIQDEYGPNVYLTACYVKDKKFAQSEIPLRVYVPTREVKVAVKADKAAYTPGAPINYEVTTTDIKGRPVAAEFSFGVVDESIYALAEDKPEALAQAFYPRRNNRVQTSWSFSQEYLGDASKAALKIEPRKKFLDTAFWQPFAQTGADGRAKISFSLPDNLTKWRATAVAQTRDTSFGFTSQKVIARKDFYVRLEKPRFLTQRDNSRLIGFVHNDTGAPQKATINLKLDGLKTTGETTQSLEIEPGKVGEISWPVSAEALDKATVTLAAWTDGTRRFTDAVEETLPLRPHGREYFTGRAGHVDVQPQTAIVTLDPKAFMPASRLTVRLTPSVISSLIGGLEYVVGYPYGCVEQTMSRFLPDILVSRVLKNSGTLDVKSQKIQSELPRMVRDGLTRLYAMQHESGGWGWWEFDGDNPWMTAYVLYGLATARQAGFAVDEEKFARGREGALALLPTAKGQNRAFLLYALALSASSDAEKKKVFIERGKTNWNGWDGEGLSYLLLTDKILDFQDPKAKAAFERRAISADGMTHWEHWDDPKRNDSWEFDYNDVTATAAGLRTILSQNIDDPRVPGVLRWLMARRTGEYWNSTRDTSFVLAALCDYLESRPGAANLSGTLSVRLNGKDLKSFTLTPQAGSEPDLQIDVPATQLRAGDNRVTFTRAGGNSPVFYSVQLRQTLATENIPALQKLSEGKANFKIEREYLRLTKPDRARSWEVGTEATGNKLRQGDSIRVKITFEAPRDMAYVLIEDPFPSGCETTERGTADETVGSDWRYGYSSVDIAGIDVRDDRIAFFARKIKAGKHTIQYHLRAQTPGVFHVLPAQIQPMYDPDTRAETSEARVEIK